MASLLDRYLQNTLITYPVSTGVLTVDVLTGDAIEQMGTPLTIRAFLKQSKGTLGSSTSQVQRPPGVNAASWLVEGRLTDPPTFALAGVSQVEYTQPLVAIVDGLPGRLLLVPVLQKAAIVNAGYQDRLGEAISGWFEVIPG